MSAVRRIALPFRFQGKGVATIEQDDPAEVEQCVRAVLAYAPGYRRGAPDFGAPPQEHSAHPDLEALSDAVALWEDRAEPAARELGTDLTGLVRKVRMTLGGDDA